MDWTSRLAIVLRSWVRGTSAYGAPSVGRGIAGRGPGALVPGAADGAATGAGATAGAPSRSRRTRRPSGPDPAIALRSIPRSAAIRRASGEALTRAAAVGPAGALTAATCGR